MLALNGLDCSAICGGAGLSLDGLRVYAVVPARNEEAYLEATLSSLVRQSLRLSGIIIVDDGSTDGTARVAARYGSVVRLPGHDESYVGRPELAVVFNEGLRRVPDDCDYVLVLGADHVLPPDYLERLISRMIVDDVRVASGYIAGEPYHPEMPRGSGRVYDFKLLKGIGFFPVNWGWESYVLFKFMQMGYAVRCYRDICAGEARRTGRSGRRMYYYGKAMRALGYDFKYAVARALFNRSLSMLRGYLSGDIRVYDDVASFVREWQRRMFWRRVRDVLGL
ncbi:hypothetical protein DRO37_09590 [Candidatus Bathyarchaeota archaeon]|nr:MAG: hypothetical protein DRO37_09590 [Candidatus Bathyarchaeota archaeon]